MIVGRMNLIHSTISAVHAENADAYFATVEQKKHQKCFHVLKV